MPSKYTPLTLNCNAIPAVQTLSGLLPPDGMVTVRRSIANRVTERMRANFTALGGTRFWMEAADATESVVTPDGVVRIEVRQPGVALQRFGLKPNLPGVNTSSKTGQKTKLLAIPNGHRQGAPINYKRPLRFVPLRHSRAKGMLVEEETKSAKKGKRGKAKKKKPVVAYFLFDHTNHEPHENVLPTNDQMLQDAAEVVMFYLKRNMT